MDNPVKAILRRLAKFLVKVGKEELDKEADRRIGSVKSDEPPTRYMREP